MKNNTAFYRKFVTSLLVLLNGSLSTAMVTVPSAAESVKKYKGSETLSFVSAAPNPGRCGSSPTAIEAQFQGQGIDTAGGTFTVVASGCQNIATGEVYDLRAIDTYNAQDSVTIVTDNFFLKLNPQTCISANGKPVDYIISSGTGAFANVRGGGTFNFVSNDPNCNGEFVPGFVFFEGIIK